MTTVSATIHIDAPTERVWEIVADLGAVATFHPYVTHSYYSSQSKAGPGARRVCELGSKMAVEETAVDWRVRHTHSASHS
jgi:ligand-binding SRPBCC domain-containing protein